MNRGIKLYVIVAMAAVAAALAWNGWYRYVLKQQRAPSAGQAPPNGSSEEISIPTKPGPQVAIVIDDVAYATSTMDQFASLGIPLTFAILPRHKLAKALSEKARAHQFAVMLHLPLEPHDVIHNDPGPAGLYLAMSEKDLKAQFDKAVASVPGIVGINNHMGSAFTEDVPKMKLVLEWTKERGLYFLDSYTSQKSVVVKTAQKVGIPCLRNETFLDNEDSVEGIEKQLDHVMKLALKRQRTIAIGHYRRKFILQALAAKIPEFKAKGIEFVTLPTFYKK